jgi:predicted phosphoribosyltransferase
MRCRFRDRREAGQLLAGRLSAYAGREDVLVLGLPRGGVPIAYEVARALHVPLDVLLVRKLGVPGHEELAMGAIASGGVQVLNDAVVDDLGIPGQAIAVVAAREQQELARRERAYRGHQPPLDVRGKTVILVDDGLATGTTMRAAIVAARAQDPSQLVVAVPVIAGESLEAFRALADALIWMIAPEPFLAVGLWYADFAPTTDAEVCELLARAAGDLSTSAARAPARGQGQIGAGSATPPGIARSHLARRARSRRPRRHRSYILRR